VRTAAKHNSELSISAARQGKTVSHRHLNVQEISEGVEGIV